MPRHLMLSMLLLPLLLVLTPTAARADAKQDMFEAWQALLAVKSFRAEIEQLEPAQSIIRIEFQAPDRFRVAIPNGPTTVVIGDTGYMEIGGRTMKLPMAMGSMTSQYRNEAFLRKLQEGMVVEDLGEDSLNGEPVRKYRFVQDVATPPAFQGAPGVAGSTESTSVAWVSAKSGLVLKIDVSSVQGGQTSRSEIRYSDFNSPAIRIQSPK
ncbi:hypothetical protein [Arenimonas alkanexedens]